MAKWIEFYLSLLSTNPNDEFSIIHNDQNDDVNIFVCWISAHAKLVKLFKNLATGDRCKRDITSTFDFVKILSANGKFEVEKTVSFYTLIQLYFDLLIFSFESEKLNKYLIYYNFQQYHGDVVKLSDITRTLINLIVNDLDMLDLVKHLTLIAFECSSKALFISSVRFGMKKLNFAGDLYLLLDLYQNVNKNIKNFNDQMKYNDQECSISKSLEYINLNAFMNAIKTSILEILTNADSSLLINMNDHYASEVSKNDKFNISFNNDTKSDVIDSLELLLTRLDWIWSMDLLPYFLYIHQKTFSRTNNYIWLDKIKIIDRFVKMPQLTFSSTSSFNRSQQADYFSDLSKSQIILKNCLFNGIIEEKHVMLDRLYNDIMDYVKSADEGIYLVGIFDEIGNLLINWLSNDLIKEENASNSVQLKTRLLALECIYILMEFKILNLENSTIEQYVNFVSALLRFYIVEFIKNTNKTSKKISEKLLNIPDIYSNAEYAYNEIEKINDSDSENVFLKNIVRRLSEMEIENESMYGYSDQTDQSEKNSSTLEEGLPDDYSKKSSFEDELKLDVLCELPFVNDNDNFLFDKIIMLIEKFVLNLPEYNDQIEDLLEQFIFGMMGSTYNLPLFMVDISQMKSLTRTFLKGMRETVQTLIAENRYQGQDYKEIYFKILVNAEHCKILRNHLHNLITILSVISLNFPEILCKCFSTADPSAIISLRSLWIECLFGHVEKAVQIYHALFKYQYKYMMTNYNCNADNSEEIMSYEATNTKLPNLFSMKNSSFKQNLFLFNEIHLVAAQNKKKMYRMVVNKVLMQIWNPFSARISYGINTIELISKLYNFSANEINYSVTKIKENLFIVLYEVALIETVLNNRYYLFNPIHVNTNLCLALIRLDKTICISTEFSDIYENLLDFYITWHRKNKELFTGCVPDDLEDKLLETTLRHNNSIESNDENVKEQKFCANNKNNYENDSLDGFIDYATEEKFFSRRKNYYEMELRRDLSTIIRSAFWDTRLDFI